jgi:site-specific DNA-methyltransferase (adenine-specific)
MIRDTDQAQLLLEDAEAVTPVVSSIGYSGVQTVIEADCLEYMATMEAGSVAAVVTSPPYNLGKKYASYNDNRPLADYLTDQKKAAAHIARILRPDGHLFLNVGSNSKQPWRSVEVAQVYSQHLVLQQRILWVKSIAIDGSALPEDVRKTMHQRQMGHFPSINGDQFLNPIFEDIWHFTPKGSSPIDRLSIGGKWGAENTLP